MGESYLVPLGISLVSILLVLGLQSFYGIVEFKLTLPLDTEDFVLQLSNQVLQGTL